MASLNPEFKRKYMSRSLSGYDSLPSGLLTGGFEAKDRPTINKNIGLYTDTCAECGARFEHTLEHAYKRIVNGRKKLYCSYHCMRAFDRRAEDRKTVKTGSQGRPRMRDADRIAYAQEKIRENQEALAECTDPKELQRIKARIKYHRKALEEIAKEGDN